MDINLKNIEELIFFDKELQKLFPEFRHLFDQWKLGQRVLGMKNLGQRSVLELLNSLNENHIVKLQEYFDDIILVDRIDHRLVVNYEYEASIETSDRLCEFSGYKDFCLYRNKDKIYLSFWR